MGFWPSARYLQIGPNVMPLVSVFGTAWHHLALLTGNTWHYFFQGCCAYLHSQSRHEQSSPKVHLPNSLQIKMHMIDPFQERQRGQQREPKWREMMQQLDVEVVGIGGWELVQSVKVEGKNAEAEFEDVRVFQWTNRWYMTFWVDWATDAPLSWSKTHCCTLVPCTYCAIDL